MRLLHSCYGFDYVKQQPIKIINRLLLAAVKKENEDAAWDKWLMQFLAFKLGGGELKSFEECLKIMEKPQIGTEDEYKNIMEGAEKARKRHQKSLKKGASK